ncbi:class I SAM-dependent rRNA methyltransferase [Aquirufa antheringensis]|uniref:class I SAM-dependent rRNA methyltransferase n=1 Tax=Aquirufa antheringensis TaxID=2516559 RepID=UPI001032CDA5|nr:class I SAM-dependent rRNA methyltransferase [Aquirufa antheringensis]MCE4216634.1 methyltransferase [Pseudarcicella sp. GAP-15]TBH70041.1 class I SAM-dependent rRNA methyltransferase [Aquirufa antheringensis]
MKSTLFIQLKPGKDAPVKRFHPWVFSGAIAKQSPNLQDGDWVNVVSSRDEFLGTGHYHNGSIAVKIISFQEIESKSDFWKKRILNAWDLRALLPLEKTNAFRLIHGEGDGCPGLIMDLYKDVLVFQAHTIGMHRDRDEIVEAIKEVLGKKIKAIYDKSRETLPTEYAQNCTNGYVYGDVAVPYTVKENGISFSINWITGQKTGFFIDQRENRALLAKYAKGKSVLNTFCYSGGFSLYALETGAASVISLDASAKAIDLVKANIELNKMKSLQHEAIVGETLPYLKANEDEFDIIVLDPPAFAKSMNAKHKALQGYQKINELALKKIKKNGLLFTYSCSQVITRDLFYNMLVAAGIAVGREIQVIHQMTQSPDHPINLFHPESNYLKGFVLKVL